MGSELGIDPSTGGRQTIAVLRADMVASTGLLNERGVDAAIDARRHATTAINQACGHAVMLDTRGDGTVVGFTSAAAGLRAAWQLQLGLRGTDEFQLRVSVTIEELAPTEMLSAAANERTQTYESRCPPGAIVIDSRVRRAVRGHGGPTFEPLDDDIHLLADLTERAAEQATPTLLRCVLFSDLAKTPGTSPPDASTVLAASEISARCISSSGGVVADTNGAGHMATFVSASAALEAAQAMHAEAATYGVRADVSDCVAFSIGISMGEVTTVRNASIGVAIVEAARLLESAPAQTTQLTRDVREIAGDTHTSYQDVGSTALRGLAEPVDNVRYDYGSSVPQALELPALFQRDQRFLMVGRETELASIQQHWQTTLRGEATSLLITGEEGVGKTRLVRDFAQVVHQQGAIVLYGACDEDLVVPYAPVVQALRQAATLDPLIAAAVDPGDGALGVLLCPDTSHHSAAPLPSQLELFDAVSNALARLSMIRPVLLVIDDLHWGDRDTPRLVDHCLESLSSSRVLVVATCRSEALETAPAVQDFLAITGPARRVHQLRLGRLTATDIIAMLESRKSTPLAGTELDLAQKITTSTGGNPLYIEELVVYLVDRQLLVNDAATGWSLAIDLADLSIPESVIDVVRRRCSRLPADDRDVLGIAAIMGTTFDIEVLAEVADLNITTIIDVLETAQTARLVEYTSSGDTYRFADEITRAAMMRHVQPARRTLVHLHIAEALERVRPNRIEELIVHWSAAVGQTARTKAVHYLRIATDRDMAAAAWESVVVRQHKVRELLEVDGVEDLDVLGSTHLALGTALRLLGNDGYHPEVMKAADMARRAGDPHRLFQSATVMMRPGSWVPEAGVVDVAIVAMCEDALLLLSDDDPIRPRVLAVMATALAWDDDPYRRAALIADAQALAHATSDQQLIGTTLMAELVSDQRPELFERGRKVADEVRSIGRATSNADLLFTGTWYVTLDLLQRGDIGAAAELLTELRSLAGARRDYFSSYLLSYIDAAMAIARCEPGAAEMVEANRVRFEPEPVDSFAVWVLQSGVLAMYAGSLANLLQPIAEAADMWHEEWGRKWDYALARSYLDIGDHDAALVTIRSTPEPAPDAYWLSSYIALAEVGLALNLADVCQSVIDHVSPFEGRLAMVGGGIAIVGQASTALGQAHLGLGRLDQAEELFREAAAQANAIGFPYLECNAMRFLAQTLLTRKSSDSEGLSLLQQVLELAEEHGFELERRGAHRQLERIADHGDRDEDGHPDNIH